MRNASWLVGLMVTLASSAALAVPTTMNFTGRLSDNAGPVNGNASIIFTIFDAATNGTQEWTETHASVAAAAGLVYVDLGNTVALDDTVFDGPAKYLEITVNGQTLTPRMKIASVPYAIHANIADNLGAFTSGDVITAVNPTNGVAATKVGNTLNVSLSTTGCASGQALKYNGSAFACAADVDTDTLPVAGTGIAVSGSTVSLSTSGCAAGSVWKYNGSAFTCTADSDTAPTGTAPIAVSLGRVISLTVCPAGQVYKSNLGGTAMVCAPDLDTTYTTGTGLTMSGAVPSIINFSTTGCAAGFAWRFTGTTWACEAVQTRVTGVCADGSAVRAVNADGTVACQSLGGTNAKAASLNVTSTSVSATFTKLNIGAKTFTKTHAPTRVRLMMHSRINASSFAGASWVRVQLRIDDIAAAVGQDHVFFAAGVEYVDLTSVFTGLAAGTHTIDLWAHADAGTATVSQDPGGFFGSILVDEY